MSDKINPEVSGRSLEEGDWIARQFLSPDDLQKSPEEYAARHALICGVASPCINIATTIPYWPHGFVEWPKSSAPRRRSSAAASAFSLPRNRRPCEDKKPKSFDSGVAAQSQNLIARRAYLCRRSAGVFSR